LDDCCQHSISLIEKIGLEFNEFSWWLLHHGFVFYPIFNWSDKAVLRISSVFRIGKEVSDALLTPSGY